MTPKTSSFTTDTKQPQGRPLAYIHTLYGHTLVKHLYLSSHVLMRFSDGAAHVVRCRCACLVNSTWFLFCISLDYNPVQIHSGA